MRTASFVTRFDDTIHESIAAAVAARGLRRLLDVASLTGAAQSGQLTGTS